MCGVNLFGYLGFLAGVQSSMSCDGVGRRGVLGGGGGVLYSSAVCRSGVSCDSGRGGSSSSGASSSSRSPGGGGVAPLGRGGWGNPAAWVAPL